MDLMYNYEGNLGEKMEGLILYLRVGTNPYVSPFWSRLFLGGHMGSPVLVLLDEETSPQQIQFYVYS